MSVIDQEIGGAVRESSLLEREAERERLARVLQPVGRRAAAAAVVMGEPGIGKTSLLAETADRARRSGWAVLAARGAPMERQYSFGVLRQLLEIRLRPSPSGPLDPDDAALLDLLSSHHPAEAPAASEFRLFHALYWWLVGQADQGPTLLMVDDAHWVDLPSLRFLNFLALRIDRHPLALLVGTRVPTEARWRELLDGLQTAGVAEVIRPAALSRDSVRDLIRAELGEPEEAFVEACRRSTAGNPLLVTALLRIMRTQAMAPTAASVPLAATVGPEAVDTHLRSLLAGRPAAFSALARAVAVTGPCASSPLAFDLAGLDPTEGDAATQGLVDLGLFDRGPLDRGPLDRGPLDRGPLDRGQLDRDRVEGLSFRHPLMASAVYQAMSPGQRAAAHERAAQLLLAQGRPAEHVAAHLLSLPPAGDARRIRVLIGAAAEARGRGASDIAGVFLRRAVAEPPPPELQSELTRQLGVVEAYLQEWPQAETHLRDAVDRADDQTQRALAAYSLSRYLEVTQRPDVSATVLTEALDRLPEETSPALRTRMLAELCGYTLMVIPRHAAWRSAVAELRGCSPSSWPPAAKVVLAHDAHLAARDGADATTVARLAGEAMDSGELAPDLSALYVAVFALSVAGRYAECTQRLQRAVDWAKVRGLAVAESLGLAYLGSVALWRGDLRAAEAELERGWQRSGGLDHSVPALLGCQLELDVELGRWSSAAEVLERHPISTSVSRTSEGLWALYGRARLHAATGRHQAALADFELLGRRYEQWDALSLLHVPWRSGAARAMTALGLPGGPALDLVRDEVELAARFGAPRQHGIALMALADLEPARAGEHSRAAVDVLTGSSADLELARAQARWGEHCLSVDDTAAARTALRAALDLADRCGALAIADRVRRHITRSGGRPGPARSEGVRSLTPTERRVAALVAEDFSNRQVAQRLYVTEKTVEYHVTNILRKLQARSRHDIRLAEELVEERDPASTP